MEGYSSDSSVMVRLIISFILCPYVCGNLFKEVSSCPSSEEEWRHRSEKKQCKEPIPDFMCAAIENQPGRFGEICTFVGLTGKGECVVLDADTYNLNFLKCYATSGCPPNAYISFDLYKYPVCYNYSRETTTSTSTTKTEQNENITTTNSEKTQRDGSVHAIVISTFILFLCVFLVYLMIWTKRRKSKREKYPDLEKKVTDEFTLLFNTDKKKENTQKSTHQANQESKLEEFCIQKLSTLGACIKLKLVEICNHKDLRYQMLMHSESLKQQFKENFDKMMKSSSVDWTKYDLDTVYTLLTNFCDILCPDRGWGYRPTNDDVSLGADIERIRTLVNEYLDNKMCKAEEANQILERWRWTKIETDPSDIMDLDHETKINYKKLKPNNIVEDGIVVTCAIANILEKLKSKKIVTCRGAIGCGKTTALKYVTKKYKDNGWTIKWIEEFMDESFFYSAIDGEKIIICCDNLFGSFGCHVFSDKMFERFRFIMHSIINSDYNIKVLLGIHEHVIEEMPSKYSFVLKDYTVFVDLDSLSQSEALLICMMQQEKSKIEQENIPFDDFQELIENRSAIVGTPFQTLMISASPDEFGTKAFYNQPFQQLIEHFTKLYHRDEEIFYSLFYIMCVTNFNTREDELKTDIAYAIYPRLDKNTLEIYLPKLAPYIQNDGDTVEMKHEVIAIALIHTFMMESNKTWSIFPACDIRRILELIRPNDQSDKLHQFVVPLSRGMLHEANTFIKTKIVSATEDISGHPLLEYIVQPVSDSLN